MNDAPAQKLPAIWFYGATVISVLLVTATGLDLLGFASGGAAILLGKLSLAVENNPAAWWSGMLLALVGLHAYDGCALLRRDEPGTARAWALIAAVLLFLSADEVGSLHERLSYLGEALELGKWSLLLPLGAVLAAMLGRALILLWSAGGEQRRKVWPLAVGFLLLGSVALQEFIEYRVQWQTNALLALRAAVEEGTELGGMLVLLRAAMANTAGLVVRDRLAFAALAELRRPLLALGLALPLPLALATAALTDQWRGHPADWLAAVAFLAAGLVACRRLVDGGGGVGWAAWGVGGLCCLASVATVAISPGKMVGLGTAEVSLRMLALGTVMLLVCVPGLATSAGRRRAHRLGVVALLAAALPWFTNLALVYLLTQLAGLAVYWANATAVKASEERFEASGSTFGYARSFLAPHGGSSAIRFR